MRVLLIEEDGDIRDRILFSLETRMEVAVINVSTIDEALYLLDNPNENEEQFKLVVYDGEKYTKRQYTKLWKRLRVDYVVGIIYCRDPDVFDRTPVKQTLLGVLSRVEILEDFYTLLDTLFKRGTFKPKDDSVSSYCPIRTALLISVSPLKVDVYIKLSSMKMLKIFRKGDVFDKKDLEKYLHQKNVENFYLRTDECHVFIKKYQRRIEELTKFGKIALEKVVEETEGALLVIRDLAQRLGPSSEVQDLTRAQVQFTVASMGKHPDLARILKRLRSDRKSYIASHSVMLAYVACSIASSLPHTTENTFVKLTYAAFLHDITLENDRLAALSTLADLEAFRANFTAKEYRAFKYHTISAADFVRRFDEIPPDVDTTIIQHHETPSGTGFPRKLNYTQIFPLAAILIFAHDIVQQIFAQKSSFSLDTFLFTSQRKYDKGRFRDVMKVLYPALE